MSSQTTSIREQAGAAALTAALAAGVSVRQLADRGECAEGSELLAQIWGTTPESAPFTSDALRSLLHAGSCVMGAFSDHAMVGLTVGLAGAPGASELYSLIAGVRSGQAGRGVGLALKLSQRAWALERGATSMVWTFDPLIRRNAHFNINRLGVSVEEYVPDFYPPMHDARNRDDLSDRLVARWDLTAPSIPRTVPAAAVVALHEGADGQPVSSPSNGPHLLVGVPHDIERIREQDAALARRWRLGIRALLLGRVQTGYRVTGFTSAGQYVLEGGAQ